jgi:prepilin-type processing-associated H-X9-DG protein
MAVISSPTLFGVVDPVREDDAMTDRDRRGFAPIELVTGVGVLLTLVALQLPQVEQARESARRSQCVRNMRQIALAMHNYHSANDVFPMSAVVGPGHGVGQGCWTQLLPYMEQQAVFNAYNFDLENWHVANATAVRVKIATFLCPSNKDIDPTAACDIRTSGDKPYPGKSTFAAGHYGANWGGVRQASGAEVARSYGENHRGVMFTVVDPDAKFRTHNIRLEEITDGLGMTLAFAEKRSSFGWAVGGWGGTEFDVNVTPCYFGDDAKLRRAFTGSNHGGINAAFCDGSVRFLECDLEKRTWYAMTTRAGGEDFKFDE